MKKYVQISTGFVLLMFMGVAYAWSLFVEPLEKEFGWDRSQTSMVFTVFMVCFCTGGILGGIMIRKTSIKKILLAEAAVMAMGFAGCANVHMLWHIVLCYGVICGTGIGIAYNVVITSVNSWFIENTGFSSGIMMMGYGTGSLVLGSVVTYFNSSFGWRDTYYILAFISAVLLIISGCILSASGRGTEDTESKNGLEGQLDPIKMVRKKSFYIYYIWQTAVAGTGLAVIGHASVIAAALGASVWLQVMATGIFSVSNGISRVCFGIVYDRCGRKSAMLAISLFLMAGVVLINVSLAAGSLVLLIAGYIFAGSGFGGASPCNAAFTKEFYGFQNYGENFGVICTAGIAASFAGPYLTGILITVMSSYRSICPVFFVFTVCALISQHILSSLERSLQHK